MLLECFWGGDPEEKMGRLEELTYLVLEALKRGEKLTGVEVARRYRAKTEYAYAALRRAKELLAAEEEAQVPGEPLNTLEAFGVKPDHYEVDGLVVNRWGKGGTEYSQVKVRLKPRGRLSDAITSAEAWKPRGHRVSATGEKVFLVGLSDLHIGMLAWSAETGEPPWDTRIATEVLEAFLDWVVGLIVEEAPDVVVLPVGGDLLHADGHENATSSGTRVDVDTRWKRSFSVAVWAMQRAIGSIIAGAPRGTKVFVPVVSGNHDTERAYYLGVALDAWAKGARSNAEVVVSPRDRVYLFVGGVLFGFTHGHRPKPSQLPLLMAIEAPTEWSQARHREWVIGHYHNRRLLAAEAEWGEPGVRIRVVPSLAPADAWHASMGFVGRRQEASLVVYEGGLPVCERWWYPPTQAKGERGR